MVNNYEYELIDHLICSINTLLNPCHSSRIKGFKQSDVEQLEKAVAVLEKLCFWDFENGEELIGAYTEDKAEPEEVPAEDEDKAELEEVPAEDEDEAEPEQVPAEDEDKAEPEQVLSNKKCFFNAHCCTSDCPNIQFDIADQRYGYGIAEDMGLKRISCKECYYYTCKCENCLFFNVCTTLKS